MVAAVLLQLALAAACSTLPEPRVPAHREHDVEAEFVVASDGRLALPTSSRDLVVHDLTLDPPPLGERFGDGARWFAYAPGTRVLVRSRFRTYGNDGGAPLAAASVFPGAWRVRELVAP